MCVCVCVGDVREAVRDKGMRTVSERDGGGGETDRQTDR